MKPTRITVHCSDSPNGKEFPAATIRRIHIKENGWSDIGYHMVIQPDGSVENGRSLTEKGAHVYGDNEGNIGICLIGEDKFTVEQFDKLRSRLDTLISTYNIPEWEIYCHYQFPSAQAQGKTCPGFKINALLHWYYTGDMDALKPNILKKS